MAYTISTEAVLAEHLSPRKSNTLHVTNDHKEVIGFCDRLVDEARAWRTELGLAERTRKAFDFLAGNQFLRKPDADYRARVVVNLFRSNVERKVAMLTDSVPQLDVGSRIEELVPFAGVLKDNCMAQWSEASMQLVVQDMVTNGSMEGCSPVTMMWDPSEEMLRSDTLFAKDVLFDRGLGKARRLQADAQYVIVRRVRPISQFWSIYGVAGRRVKPDSSLSRYELPGDEERNESGFGVRPYTRPSQRRSTPRFEHSAIPQAEEYRLYFRDPQTDPTQQNRPDSEMPDLLFPRKRVIVWSRDTLLFDGQNQNWDGKFPLELFDWGFGQTHAHGSSELEAVETLQVALNLLVSGVVHNARLANDPPWKITEGALDPEDLAKFRKWRDRPGWAWMVAPNAEMEPFRPEPMGNVVFSTIELIQNVLQQITGVTPVTQGQRPEGVTSGIALDSLLLASQYTIRMQARTVEAMLERLGQLMVSRIIQYFSDNRISYATNEREVKAVLYQRAKLLKAMGETKDELALQQLLERVQMYFRFIIKPYSALAVAKIPQIQMWERWADKKWMLPWHVMELAQVPDPENEYQQAQQLDAEQQARIQVAIQEQQAQAAMQKQMQNGGPPGAPVNGPQLPNGPQAPANAPIHGGTGPALPPSMRRVPPTLMGGVGEGNGGAL